MASLSRSADGKHVVQFVDPDGKRRTVRLGKCDKRTAESTKTKIEALLNAKNQDVELGDDLSKWVKNIGAELHGRLVAVGLIDGRRSSRQLGEFIRAHIAGRTDLAPSTREAMETGMKRLLAFFGEDRRIRSVLPADIDRWIIWLAERELAQATIGRTVRRAREFFKAAVRDEIIEKNPVEGVKAAGAVNDDRLFYVPAETIYRIVEIASPQWQLIIALARFGGLRIPSEINKIRLEDIDLERGRLTVHAPKTKRHRGKEKRVIPLFPEIVEHIERAYHGAKEGQVYLIENKSMRRKCCSVSLRKHFLGLLGRAGVKPWPRLFHALRGSAETDLAQRFPIHICAAWLGHSPKIATRHYLSVTDADYQKAINGIGEKSAAKSAALEGGALHFSVQTVQDSKGRESTQALDPVTVSPTQSFSVRSRDSVQAVNDGPVTLILDTKEV
jgi:integrase